VFGNNRIPKGQKAYSDLDYRLKKEPTGEDRDRLQHPESLLMDEVRLHGYIKTFDKPRLIRDLLRGADVKYTPIDVSVYDRVIDATGASRALLPSIDNDMVLPTQQYRVKITEVQENRVKLGGIGYAWCFPIARDEYHIGCGSLLSNPQEILDRLGWVKAALSQGHGTVVCKCTGRVRLTGTHGSVPFVETGASEVWGVGEAIGCVAPLAGDGVIPGLRSVQILLECWDAPDRYTERILREFRWMKREKRVFEKLRRGDRLGLTDGLALRTNAKRMGMDVDLRDAVTLVKRIR
jgi:flavin-dependent dehydrogenase